METRDMDVTLSEPEVSMVEPELIRQARGLRGQGWGSGASHGSWGWRETR